MLTTAQVPAFASADWYADPKDHRCPHDAWLEAVEIAEPATGERAEIRSTQILLRLLGAYQDGHIVFRYSGVQSYSLGTQFCAAGLGDWLSDDFAVSASGSIIHRIEWSGHGPRRQTIWTIECREISYEWIPKS